jgi:hypothetical protein
MRLATLLTVLALAATACGSDKSSSSSSDTSAADWANGVCTAVTTYTQSVTDAATSLKGNVSKDGIDEATKQIQSATETFEDDVKGLGKPETAFDQLKSLDAKGELSDAFNSATSCASLR